MLAAGSAAGGAAAAAAVVLFWPAGFLKNEKRLACFIDFLNLNRLFFDADVFESGKVGFPLSNRMFPTRLSQ